MVQNTVQITNTFLQNLGCDLPTCLFTDVEYRESVRTGPRSGLGCRHGMSTEHTSTVEHNLGFQPRIGFNAGLGVGGGTSIAAGIGGGLL